MKEKKFKEGVVKVNIFQRTCYNLCIFLYIPINKREVNLKELYADISYLLQYVV